MRTRPRYRAEPAAWTTPGGVGRRDGVPREAFGPRDAHDALPLRDFALGHGAPSATVAFEPDPTLILLFTNGDTAVDWLRAAAALQRVMLKATPARAGRHTVEPAAGGTQTPGPPGRLRYRTGRPDRAADRLPDHQHPAHPAPPARRGGPTRVARAVGPPGRDLRP